MSCGRSCASATGSSCCIMAARSPTTCPIGSPSIRPSWTPTLEQDAMSTTLLEVAALEAGYGDALVLKNVSLKVIEGSITAIIGANGAGKTTLMRALAGILPIRSGAIAFDGRSLAGLSPGQRVDFGIAMVPEGRLVFPDLNIQETLRIGAYTRRARAG